MSALSSRTNTPLRDFRVVIGEPEKIAAFIAEGLRDYQDGDNHWGEERPEKVIDFTKIVPEPENIEHGGCPHAGSELGPGYTYRDKDGREMVCWYAWNASNWGTKWNAYSHTHYAVHTLQRCGTDGQYSRVDLRFETAWSQPTPVFEAIEERWGVTVHAVTQDEGGYPDVLYGDPFEEELISRRVEMDFECWDEEAA